MRQFLTQQVDGEAIPVGFNWQDIQTEAVKHKSSIITVDQYTPAQWITLQQIRWWKGILMPALRRDTGDTVSKWETTLKFAVMPDEFKPEIVMVDGMAVNCVPSITTLSCKKTNQLIEDSVEWLHDNGFDWVTLPDSALRVTK